ncbi:hypothetical protein PsYK624_044970 [Phanerochaete sordida]|uniref:Uncharacterized protein n=1 Tax=Phanerochaete sordida TaxID=48140 RepID=A0A9P3G6K0_9APHY|nr:hypothetical protein PsYK624_044970 [Phanerochaete sordida]
MHDVADPVRYHSISLVGNRQLFAFADRLAALQSTPIVHHLFIAGLQVRYVEIAELGSQFSFERWHELQTQTRADIAKLSATILTILAIAAPRLHSLGIHDWNVDLGADDLPTFPFLHDITLVSRPRGSLVPDGRFPSLRRLHIYTASTGLDFWLALTHLTSRATHLRLSGLSEDSRTPRFLRVLLNLPAAQRAWHGLPTLDVDDGYAPDSPEAAQAVELAARFLQLEHVSVQPASYGTDDDWRCETGERTHARMGTSLARLAAESERGEGVRTFVLLPEQRSYGRDEARRDWLNVIEGGEGPWSPGFALCGNASPAERAVSLGERCVLGVA